MKKVLKVVLFVILGIILVLLAINLYVCGVASRYIMTEVLDTPESQAVIILGAGIMSNGELSPILRDRAVTAIDFYNAGKTSKILITGNSIPPADEVSPVVDFLLENGVGSENIMTDKTGLNTYTSMLNAKTKFGLESVTVSTQKFHLSRAVYIARSLGLDTHGLVADNGKYFSKNYLREFFARPKAFFEVMFRQTPA